MKINSRWEILKGVYGLLLLGLLCDQLFACQRTKQEPAESQEEVLPLADSTPVIKKRLSED